MTRCTKRVCFFFLLLGTWIFIGIFLFYKKPTKRQNYTMRQQVQDISVLISNQKKQEYLLGARQAFQVAYQSPFFNLEKPWASTVIRNKKVLLSAHTGIFNQKKRQAYLCHRVTMNWDHGAYVITTQKALMDEQKKSIYGRVPVQGKGVYGHFFGQGFVLNQDELCLHGPASMHIKMD